MPDFPYHRIDVRALRALVLHGQAHAGPPLQLRLPVLLQLLRGGEHGRRALAGAVRRAHRQRHAPAGRRTGAPTRSSSTTTTSSSTRRAPPTSPSASWTCDIGWWGEARIDTLLRYSDRTWELMRDSGLRMVFMGAESGSDETLKRMNKGGTASTDKTLEIAEKMRALRHRAGVLVRARQSARSGGRRRQTRWRSSARSSASTRTPRSSCTSTRPCRWRVSCTTQAKAEGFAFPETLEEWISDDWQDFSQRRSAHDPVARRSAAPPHARLRARAERLLPDDHQPQPARRPTHRSCAPRAPGATTWASTATRSSCARCSGCWPTSAPRRAASSASIRLSDAPP